MISWYFNHNQLQINHFHESKFSASFRLTHSGAHLEKHVLCSRRAHFKRAYHIQTAVLCPCPQEFKKILFGGF